MSHPAAQELSVSELATHRTYTIRRSTALIGLALLGITSAGCGAAGWYILNKDDLAARLIVRETTRQYAYEDRIASLRADIDRLSSRALLDQDGVEARVDELVSRQAELESKQALVASVTGALQAGGLLPAIRGKKLTKAEQPVAASSVSSFAPIAPGKPTPAPEEPSLRGGESSAAPWRSGSLFPAKKPEPPSKRVMTQLKQLDGAFDVTAESQIAILRELDVTLAKRQQALRSALSGLGVDPERIAPAEPPSGVGGPFVPIKIDPASGPFEATLHALQPRIAAVFKLRGAADALPLQRPMDADIDLTSNFGYRLDPFTRGPAMHSGIDFRAETGTPIRAAAPGKVITAEYSGGYGNMVEIEHAGGITTRYAHMSAILVRSGQSVTTGTQIGRVGSTGRSTGPHLHYETRLNDEALDPMRFLRAGARLATVDG